MKSSFFDSAPLWSVFIATIVFVFLAVELGFRAGIRSAARSENERQAPIDAMVGSTLGLLAFVLAFTFGMATSRFDTRNQLLVDDVVAIRTADLRTQLLPEPNGGESRALLKEYVDIRILRSSDLDRFAQINRRTQQIQDELWARTAPLLQDASLSSVVAPALQAIIQMNDVHTKRVTAGIENRLPFTIWIALYCITGLAMAISGYRTGVAGRRSVVATITLVFAYSTVILLIADLDRPQEGLLKVDQQPMIDLQMRMHRREETDER